MSKYTRVVVKGHQYYKVQITLPNKKRKTLYAKTISMLKTKELDFLNRMASDPNFLASAVPTVAEYTLKQMLLMTDTVSRKTYEGYESKVRLHILPYIGEMKISDVCVDDIRLVLQSMENQSESSYSKVHMLLCRIFGAAKLNHVISDNPMDHIKSKGGKPQKMVQPLTDDQVKVLLDAVRGLKVEPFILLALYTGLRREEILALQWDCVVLDAQAPHINVCRAWRTYGNRPEVNEILKSKAAYRSIPIPGILIDYLRHAKKNSTSDYVISNKNGGTLTSSQWRNLWNLVKVRTTEPHTYTTTVNGQKVNRTIIPVLGEHAVHNPSVVYSINFHITPHQLRHTYVTNLIYSGADPKTVQYLAGHESSQITMDIYAAVKYTSPERLAGIVNSAFSAPL